MSPHSHLPSSRPAPRRARALARMAGSALLAWSAAAAVHAQGAPAADATADLGSITQRWLDDALQRSQVSGGSMPLRMEVSVGQLDSRLRLAPCARVEPYLPAGSRLWGRTRLGLRCVEGATAWNVFLPVTVKAYGPAWVLTGNVASGAVLTEADATQAEVDWAAETTAIVANPENWVGQVASRPLMAGQALRQHMVKAPMAFRAGSPVRVVAQGRGYSVTSAGQAVTAGSIGETVRVRMDNGRVIAGIVSNDGTVEVGL
ncbi:flagellar biosynthesis protein FlgA [Paracidovorax avenae]|uniref:flagellar basal body P-ring formation chaperone FlgA n=1 Tax=Paracidovorax avenae TaxID=80867 RepID=UPI000D2022DA|nr:flagellar basal body P-ring formation chaperone FlgA [Paracidovorax avenae]AVS86239.1 flagellar biosynthesis protein FlgA [Paracidovorax avenae]AVS93296.1 flagellar biosynthesis protein FlgA [Paracidovorax avenae]AVT10984.1 flagellar biosynthesis protein FlgA [Paracidovorax avenae]